MSKLDNSGERMVPELHKGRNMYGCHIARYKAALPFVTNKKVLDIACGSGYGTQLLSKYAKNVVGVDVSAETISYAKKHFKNTNITYKKGDGEQIPLDNSSVDVVVSYETIEHIKDYKKFMEEIKRVLTPEGVLLLSTPNDDEYPEGNPYHFYEFDYKELRSLIKDFFKFHDDYAQNQWYSSTLFSTDLQRKEWEQKTNTINTCTLAPEEALYFLVVCSDKKIQHKIEPISVIGEHYRVLDIHKEGKEAAKIIKDLKEQSEKYRSLYEAETSALNRLRSSKSVRLTKPLRITNDLIRRLTNK